MKLFHDPAWPRAHEWLARRASHPALTVLGVPYAHSITPGRTDLAPAVVRSALQRYSTWDLENDGDLTDLAVHDYGDLALEGTLEESFDTAVHGIHRSLGHSQAIVLLGGDNSVTRPGVHALGVPLARVGLITLDAHFDLRSLDDGLHNGNPVRALLADGLRGSNIYQVGIQSFANSPAYARVARENEIHMIAADRVHSDGIDVVMNTILHDLANRTDAIYVDIDLDVLDRAYAPAAPGSRAGGLEPWQLRRAAWRCGRAPKVRAMDLVEMDPTKDTHDTTALTAAACLLSFAAGVLARSAA